VIPRFQLYLFDVDGTLLDSAPDICWAMRSALDAEGVRDVPEAYLRTFIGYHLRDLFLDALPHYQEEQIQAMIAHYRRVYPARGHIGTKVYAGVGEMLAELPGWKSTATTKATETASAMLRQFELIHRFDHVQGTDGFPSKPNPEVLLRSLARFQVQPEQCLFIGDAAPDMEAGRAAGVKTCAVRYGYGNLEHMAAHQPDYWIDSPLELLPAC
jgi:HAD superfamily hydrolase (TIGR01509 family)